jgi:hypothetical protein
MRQRSIALFARFLAAAPLLATAPAAAQEAPLPAVGAAPRPLSEELADVEHRMGDLEAQMNVTRARLELLLPEVHETGAARVRITHADEMSDTYRLVRVAFAIDGARVYLRSDPDGVEGPGDVEIFDGAIPAGDHVLGVELEYRGRGYGVFSYLESYRFRVTSSHTFHAVPGEHLDVRVVGYEDGRPFVSVDEAPAVRYVEDSRSVGE